MARGGGGQNGGGVQLHGGHAAGVADGAVDGGGTVTGEVLPLAEVAAPVVGGVLGGFYGADHGLQRLQRVFARGGLAGEHDAAGAVKDGVGHVTDLGPGGPGVADHGVQHLGGGDHVFAGGHAFGDHLFLDDGNLLSGDLHAQIAPGHHGAVGHGQDLVEIVHALPVFDFGDDADGLSAPFVQLGTDVQNVLSLADEGGGHKIKVVLGGETQVLTVLIGEGGKLYLGVGDVDGLVVGKLSAGDNGAADVLPLHLGHGKLHKAVVDEDAGAGGHFVMEVVIGHGDPVFVPVPLPGGKGEPLAFSEGDGSVLKGADADLGTLGVQHGGHRAALLIPDAAQSAVGGQVAFVGAVGEVETGAIHAGADKTAEHLVIVHGGTKGANHFRFTQIHCSFLHG